MTGGDREGGFRGLMRCQRRIVIFLFARKLLQHFIFYSERYCSAWDVSA